MSFLRPIQWYRSHAPLRSWKTIYRVYLCIGFTYFLLYKCILLNNTNGNYKFPQSMYYAICF